VRRVSSDEDSKDAKVRVIFRKYDGSLHWHTWLQRLGEDHHGTWLGATTDVAWQRGSEPPIQMPAPHVVLIPVDRWWVAAFNAEPAKLDVYVDVTTTPEWRGADEVTMVDLDLDVVRHRHSGAVELLDEDEFLEHQVRYGYPAEVIRRGHEVAGLLLDAVTNEEPFLGAYGDWLARVR
jgi:uncharacterized protein